MSSDLRCLECGARTPTEHPAVGGGGEVTNLCEDPYHRSTAAGREAYDRARTSLRLRGMQMIVPDSAPTDAAAAVDAQRAQVVTLRLREGDQPLPVGNDLPVMHDLVIEDLRRRLEVGIRRYGQPLQPFNGRNALRDAYEEVLDLAVYLRQAIWEVEHPPEAAQKPDTGNTEADHGTYVLGERGEESR